MWGRRHGRTHVSSRDRLAKKDASAVGTDSKGKGICQREKQLCATWTSESQWRKFQLQTRSRREAIRETQSETAPSLRGMTHPGKPDKPPCFDFKQRHCWKVKLFLTIRLYSGPSAKTDDERTLLQEEKISQNSGARDPSLQCGEQSSALCEEAALFPMQVQTSAIVAQREKDKQSQCVPNSRDQSANALVDERQKPVHTTDLEIFFCAQLVLLRCFATKWDRHSQNTECPLSVDRITVSLWPHKRYFCARHDATFDLEVLPAETPLALDDAGGNLEQERESEFLPVCTTRV